MEDCSSVLVIGGSGSGKTTWILNVINNLAKVYENPPISVHYFYSVYQSVFTPYEESGSSLCPGGIHFQSGLPSESDITAITSDGQIHMIVLDDMFLIAGNDENVCRLFTQTSHHSRVNIFLLTQNVFQKSKFITTITRNTTYFVFTKSPQNSYSVMQMAKQIYPGKTKFLTEAYEDIIKEIFGVMVLDLHPKTDPKYRVSSNILDEDPVIYIPY